MHGRENIKLRWALIHCSRIVIRTHTNKHTPHLPGMLQ